MSVDLTIRGEVQQKEIAAKLLREAARFQRRISQTTQKTVQRVYLPTMIGLAPTFLPSGYTPLVQADVQVRTSVKGSRVTAKVSAPTGGPKGRAVDRLEVGELRHPVFAGGPRKKWRWALQRVRAGFASVPLKATKPLIIAELDLELHEIARDVERG